MNSEKSLTSPRAEESWQTMREHMVATQIANRGIADTRVLQALLRVPRHLFVPEEDRPYSYRDYPLSIGYEQTISQPYIVAYMTEKIQPAPQDKVLEIGTGSGYQTAVLAELVDTVYSIEIIPALSEQAGRRLESLGYRNIHLFTGNGYEGRPQESPFNAIILTAAPPALPLTLVQQLAPGGRMILPIGRYQQELALVTHSTTGKWTTKNLLPVRFVPMTGQTTKFTDLR